MTTRSFEEKYGRGIDAENIVGQITIDDARAIMQYELGIKPSSRLRRNAFGSKAERRPGEEIYYMKLPTKFMVAIGISEKKASDAKCSGVCIRIFDYDSNRITSIEHAQHVAINMREIVTETLSRRAISKKLRGTYYS